MPDTQSTQSALDVMTAGIMGVKEQKAAGLTPVGMENASGEPKRMPDLKDIFMPQEYIEAAVREVRTQATAMLDACDRIERSLGNEPASAVVDEAAVTKTKEREADAKFADAFAAKQKAAQAAAFTARDEADSLASDKALVKTDTEGGWQCPNGHDTLNQLTSRKGRVYMICTTCHEFER